MGEAKRRADLGPTRKIRVTRAELTELVNYLLRPGDDGKPRKTENRGERKSLKRALRQTGALVIWDLVLDKGAAPPEAIKTAVPETAVATVTVETIDYILATLKDMSISAGLTLVDLEEKLEDAKAGINLVDDEEESEPAEGKSEARVIDLPSPQ